MHLRSTKLLLQNMDTNYEIKCPNYIICSNMIVHKDTSYDGVCLECYNLFGKWRNKNHILYIKHILEECPLCNKQNIAIQRPSCDHFLCIDCFKKFYFGIELKKPIFPYIEKEYQYWLNIENNMLDDWMNDDKIIEYLSNLNYWKKITKLYLKTTSKCFECYKD